MKFYRIFLELLVLCGILSLYQVIPYAVGQLIISSRVKSAFLHLTLKVGYNSRKFGMTLSGRNYITCRSILAAASRE